MEPGILSLIDFREALRAYKEKILRTEDFFVEWIPGRPRAIGLTGAFRLVSDYGLAWIVWNMPRIDRLLSSTFIPADRTSSNGS